MTQSTETCHSPDLKTSHKHRYVVHTCMVPGCGMHHAVMSNIYSCLLVPIDVFCGIFFITFCEGHVFISSVVWRNTIQILKRHGNNNYCLGMSQIWCFIEDINSKSHSVVPLALKTYRYITWNCREKLSSVIEASFSTNMSRAMALSAVGLICSYCGAKWASGMYR